MSTKSKVEESLAPHVYVLWTPQEAPVVHVGPEQKPVTLPLIPLPLHRPKEDGEVPSVVDIGQGVYDYLRQFPDCPHNVHYAEILRDAYPHFLADLGSQIAMLDHKEVDADYVKRKITYLKIFALLEPDKASLLQTIGTAFYDLALTFSELRNSYRHLVSAASFLQKADNLKSGDPATLNYLGQIDYLMGDYPGAIRRWSQLIASLDDGKTQALFREKVARLEQEGLPAAPMISHLEAIGAAMAAYGQGSFREALEIMEYLEEQTPVPQEFPSPQFYVLLALCRRQAGDAGGAVVALQKALLIDPDYAPAREEMEVLTAKGTM